jgi:hypothetical protein
MMEALTMYRVAMLDPAIQRYRLCKARFTSAIDAEKFRKSLAEWTRQHFVVVFVTEEEVTA